MAERYVFCGGLSGGNRPNALHIDVNAPAGTSRRVNLHIADISGPLADNIPETLTDMLEIAAYVYCADQFTTRGTSQMTDMGARWRRRFHFKIPVRRLDVWGNPEIADALKNTLGFLSEDDFEFDFVQASQSLPLQSYLGFSDPAAQTIAPEEVILFSGGLDSFAGTVQALIGGQKRVALVSHQGSKMIASKQNGLIASLRERSNPSSLFYIPVTINKGQEEAAEFTQRTRSLMFATLGLIVARMFGRNDLSFYENGVMSINLPISEHILGSRASRTTHPRVFADFSRLFSLLLAAPFVVRNHYLWKTKGEVLRVLADQRCADLIPNTFSCTRVREATKQGRHCGVCSQCVDRRFGVLAAGLGANEPAENYILDLFLGAQEPGAALTMIESFVVRAQKLATMSEQAFVASYGQIFRVLPYLEGSADQNVKKIWDLHRRHGQEIVSVVDAELQNTASLDQALARPSNSLLSMIVSPIAKQPDYEDPVESEPTAAEQAAADVHDYASKQIAIAVDADAAKVVFRGGIEMGGSIYELVAALCPEFEEDLNTGTFRDQYRFVPAAVLAKRLQINPPSLRQCVSRARRKIERSFLAKFDLQLDADDVIQNKEWKGYRLNPYLLLVKPTQLREQSQAVSQVGAANVTSRGAAS
jgi:7-cyano-7-deazaguanine synthase in queuosine biosynthesis